MAHLTSEDRYTIDRMLRSGNSLTQIASVTKKAVSTISREILKHAIPSNKVFYGRILNCCRHRHLCTRQLFCEDQPFCTKTQCRTCKRCNSICDAFEPETCQRLMGPPYVCNGCEEERKCTLLKQYYIPKEAQKDYRSLLTECRSGANITEAELLQIDGLVSPLLQQGQSLHHICANNPNEMTCSIKTLYRYINGGLLTAKNLDQPRVVRMKPRKTKPIHCKIDQRCRIGRTFDDFSSFRQNHPDIRIVEMDTVEGRKGGKVLLTLHFTGSCDLMMAFLRERNTAQSVLDIFDHLCKILGTNTFHRLFPLLLTDRGTEFSNPAALETASDGSQRTHIFYCDPQASWQKPNVELNHQLIRRILPKGHSFDHLQQSDINLMMSHINSYGREKLNDKSPYEAFSFLFGQDILESLDLSKIPANSIVLRPELLKK